MTVNKGSWRVFGWGLATFVLAVLSLTSYTLWLLRNEAVNNSLQVSSLLTRSFESLLTQTLQTIETAALNSVTVQGSPPDRRRIEADFAQLLRGAPHLRSLSLIDAQDRILASSNPANVGQVRATGDYFPLTDGPQRVLRVGATWLGRDFDQGRPADGREAVRAPSSLLALTLPLPAPGGPWRLLVGLNTDYFVNHMVQQIDPEAGMIEVLRLDGSRLLSTQPDLPLGPMACCQALIEKTRLQEYGQLEDLAAMGRPALTAFRVSAQYPLVVVSHQWRAVALGRWLNEAQTIATVVLAALLAMSALAVGYQRRQWQLEAQRAESARLQRINAACVFTNIRDGIMITQADGTITDVNEAFSQITGYSREEAMGRKPSFLSSGHHDRAFYEAMWRTLLATRHWRGEIWNRRKDGELFAEMLTISAVPDSAGQVQQYVAVFNNITAMKVYQNELEHSARYDALTDLPNRALLGDRLRQAMSHAARRQQLLAIVFIDLDGFKAINDTYGHEAGDLLLVTVSQRMRQVLRDSDTLARHGGDEFVALLADLPSLEAAAPTLNRLLEAAAEPVKLNGAEVRVSASLGVSFYPQAGPRTADDLLHEADLAMYQAKLDGKNKYQLAAPPQPGDKAP